MIEVQSKTLEMVTNFGYMKGNFHIHERASEMRYHQLPINQMPIFQSCTISLR